MNTSARSIHLLVERIDRSSRSASRVVPGTERPCPAPDRLEIEEGVNYLALSSRRPPALIHGTRRGVRNLVLLQPLWHYQSPKLLMLIPESLPVKVNGTSAPPVSLLDEKDEVSFHRFSRYVIHVTLYHSPRVGPPREKEIGAKCPICKVKFTEDTMVYRCHNCSKPLHIEDERKSKDKRLECAAICTECPTCHAEIQMNSGYRYLPEFCSK